MTPSAGPEHDWLRRLVGEWRYTGRCAIGPDKPWVEFSGTESVRALGDFWVVGEGRGEMPGCGPSTTIISMGFDPDKGRFVGTFMASMMPQLWLYDGVLDATRQTLTLDTEGPSMTGDDSLSRYQDIVEIADPDLRHLRSRALGPDGQWREFMTSEYRRLS